MKINIHRQNCDDLMELNKVRWTLFQKNNLLIFALYAFSGIIILFTQSLRVDSQFWGPIPSLGLAMIFLSLTYFYHSLMNKMRFLKKTRQYIDRFHSQTEGIEISITDSIVSYKDFESITEMRWTAFSHYIIYKDYIFLLTTADYLGGLVIKKTEISSDELKELLDFVTRRLPQKV